MADWIWVPEPQPLVHDDGTFFRCCECNRVMEYENEGRPVDEFVWICHDCYDVCCERADNWWCDDNGDETDDHIKKEPAFRRLRCDKCYKIVTDKLAEMWDGNLVCGDCYNAWVKAIGE